MCVCVCVWRVDRATYPALYHVTNVTFRHLCAGPLMVPGYTRIVITLKQGERRCRWRRVGSVRMGVVIKEMVLLHGLVCVCVRARVCAPMDCKLDRMLMLVEKIQISDLECFDTCLLPLSAFLNPPHRRPSSQRTPDPTYSMTLRSQNKNKAILAIRDCLDRFQEVFTFICDQIILFSLPPLPSLGPVPFRYLFLLLWTCLCLHIFLRSSCVPL